MLEWVIIVKISVIRGKRFGFTGTRKGMSAKQRLKLRYILRSGQPSEFHHGDCKGADQQAHISVRQLTKAKIIVHPPIKDKQRAFCNGDDMLEEKEYLDRNRDIVDSCDILIATPEKDMESIRSGTWATIRYGRSTAHMRDPDFKVYIILPKGGILNGVGKI